MQRHVRHCVFKKLESSCFLLFQLEPRQVDEMTISDCHAGRAPSLVPFKWVNSGTLLQTKLTFISWCSIFGALNTHSFFLTWCTSWKIICVILKGLSWKDFLVSTAYFGISRDHVFPPGPRGNLSQLNECLLSGLSLEHKTKG